MPQREETKGNLRLIVKCALFALAVTAVLLAFFALLVVNGILSPANAIWAVLVAETAGAFTGGRIAARRSVSRKLPIAALTGLCLFGILLILGFLLAFPPARHILFILPAAIIPAMLGALEKPKKATFRK
jgi:putative membrane protein (TIGR04086 family)